ncbi:hypothetical protein V1477_018631 [Vespula maculifrons]|uniref:Uncharacterized protein n=1 Tax=Vespula maculifrons TaxID=7453 RepID=A0ABD2AWB4_VESMC
MISLIFSIFYVKLNCEVGMLGLNKTVEWERLASIKLWSGRDWLRETITRIKLWSGRDWLRETITKSDL